MANHLKKEFPRLLRLSRVRLPKTTQWETQALHFLRGHPATEEISTLMQSFMAEIPALMTLSPNPTHAHEALLEEWRVDNQNVATKQQEPEVEEDEMCPVCLALPTTRATSCGHRFCDTCLDICARARPYEPLTCPMCRNELRPPLRQATLRSPPPGIHPTLFSGGRPRINEDWLSEAELATYLGYYVPILNNN